MAFTNYLLKVGSTVFPMKYMAHDSYKVTPAQRMEVKASRDSTGVLHRNTVTHTAVKIVFSTPFVTNADVNAINTILHNAYTVEKERKLNIEYYDPETDSYKTATCYMPDIDYDIYSADTVKHVITYNPIELTFIEY